MDITLLPAKFVLWIAMLSEAFSQLQQLPERHIKPRPKPSNSPVPDRFFLDTMNANPHQYVYMMNNEDLCDGPVFLLILVRSAPGHGARRQAIRETWGDVTDLKPKVVLAFLLGTTSDPAHRQQLDNEYLTHNDIIQENYHDSYRNLTVKDVSAFKWTSLFCRDAEYVMVGSDEILVDMTKLMKFLKPKQENEEKKFVVCHLYPCCTRVLRVHPKYNVTVKEYESSAWPSYCSGTAYVVKPRLAEQLYYMAVDTPSFMPDDAYLGVLAEKLGAEFHDTYLSFTGIRNKPTVLKDFNNEKYLDSKKMIAVLDYDFPGREAEMMQKLFRKMLKYYQLAAVREQELERKKKEKIDSILWVLGAIFVVVLCLMARRSRSFRRKMTAFTQWRP